MGSKVPDVSNRRFPAEAGYTLKAPGHTMTAARRTPEQGDMTVREFVLAGGFSRSGSEETE